MAESLIERYSKQLASLSSDRQEFEPDWRDLADMYKSTQCPWLIDRQQGKVSKRSRRNKKAIDGTGIYSRRVLQAGLMSGLSSPSRPWLKAVVPDPELLEFAPVARWLHAVEQRVLDVYARSNYYDVLQTQYGDWGTFGTMAFLMDEDQRRTISCTPLAIGSYYISTNSNGVVDTLFRRLRPSTRKMVQMFTKEKVSRTVREEYERGDYFTLHDVVHVIHPNDERDYERTDAKNLPFKSCYYEPQEKEPLRESGYEESPIICARWDLDSPEDDWGVGPGLIGLGAARALQLQQKRKAAAIDKHIDPPLVADSAMRTEVVSQIPGDITYSGFLANGGAPKVQTMYQTQPNIQGLLEDIQELKAEINKAMFVDVFLMLTGDARAQPPTAEEVRARETERMLMLGPVVERGKTEIHQPSFDRTFAIMVRRSMPYWLGILNGEPMLPPPPEELHGVPLKVELISVLAQAQRAVALSGIERLTTYVGNVAVAQAKMGTEPTAADKLNIDQSIDEYSQALGVSPNIVRSDDEVAQLREQRAQQKQQAQAAAMAEQQSNALANTAGAAKDLSETQVGGASALDRLVGAA